MCEKLVIFNFSFNIKDKGARKGAKPILNQFLGPYISPRLVNYREEDLK